MTEVSNSELLQMIGELYVEACKLRQQNRTLAESFKDYLESQAVADEGSYDEPSALEPDRPPIPTYDPIQGGTYAEVHAKLSEQLVELPEEEQDFPAIQPC